MIELSSYKVTDPYFGVPYIDVDEDRTDPLPHRHVHGGFEGTSTRFRFYFPPANSGYEGRMFNPLMGGHGGSEDFFGTAMGEGIGGLSMCFRLGGFMIESNQGHIGDDLDHIVGDDPTLYGHRASAEVGRLSKFVAAQVYGEAPHHSYVFGGSGGGRRSPLCLENAPDVWDAAMPFMGGGDIAEPGNTKHIRAAQALSFASMFNVQRLLGEKIYDVIDAVAPGGSGDPYTGLDTHQREELASLYRQGYPRGDEFMIAQPMGQIWLWCAIADMLDEQDPTYFPDFWTEPGYVGVDQPECVQGDLIDTTVKVSRVITAAELMSSAEFDSPEYLHMRTMAMIFAAAPEQQDVGFAVVLEGVGEGYRMGAGLKVMTGDAAGRQLYALAHAGDLFFVDGRGDAQILRLTGVQPGDEIQVDNRKFLAFCYYPRYHLMEDPQFDSLRVDGFPVHRQHPVPVMSPLMGVCYSGQFEGKLMWVHHTHDASLWPHQGIMYRRAVEEAQGQKGLDERFRLRWSDNAEHVPPAWLPSAEGRATNTWLIDYMPIIEQSLADLVDWVEHGIDPAVTSFEYHDGKVTLPESAGERGGIQPVVSVAANGSTRAEVKVGEPVTLEVLTAVPPGGGTIVSVDWDFDGTGSFPFRHDEVDGSSSDVKLSTVQTYDAPGTYFVTALVHSHRDGDVSADTRRIPNLAQARVIVT